VATTLSRCGDLPSSLAHNVCGIQLVVCGYRQLQWKKTGPHVTSWANRPSAADGFTSGRALSVWTQRRYLWYAQPTNAVKLVREKDWEDVADTGVRFELAEAAALRLMYSLTVRPDQTNATDPLKRRDDVGARLLVDGLPYRESASVVSLTCLVSCAGVLEGEVTLPLQPGPHTVQLQWRKFGTFTKAWRNDPGLLDGYAASRSLMVIGDRYDAVAVHPLERARVSDKQWQTVGNHSLTFHLPSTAIVLFSYALPASQHSNPNFDSWTYERWTSIGARLVVDSVPYT
jgi:hypothetical protein